jgi:hypothetical protein
MACEYIFNGVEYKDKQTFIEEFVKPNFINQPKTLRVQELQQPDFLKFIRKDKDYLKSQGLTDQEVDFLNLLFAGDEKWATFFIKSVIQDAAKKGYEKVLFPTGNTASKVEGHTTLEEFKKQKEDRIKKLLEYNKQHNSNIVKTEEQIQTINSLNEQVDNGQLKQSLNKQISEFKQSIKAYENEINQLKQELKRVETEGFGALKPIYNFYENTVTNILNKIYGKVQDYSNTPIKNGVDNLFEENKELSKIGNKQLYSAYLDTIFPDSKVKDIVYRGDDYFEENKGFLNKANDKKYTNGVYFAKSKREAASYSSNRKVYSAIIKLDNPIQSEVLPEYKKDKLNNNALTLEEISNLKKEGHDGLDITLKQESGFEYLVFEPKQIHILGSKQDIEGFKDFVKESSKPKVSQITDEYGNTWNEIELKETYADSEILLQKNSYDEIVKHYLASEYSKQLLQNIQSNLPEDVEYPNFKKIASRVIWQNEVDNITKRASVVNVQGVLKPIVEGRIKSKDQLPGYNRSIAKFINDRHHPLFFPNAVAQTKQYNNDFWVEDSISESYLKFLYSIVKKSDTNKYSEIDAIEAYEMLQEAERGYLQNMMEGGYMVVDGEVLPLDQTLQYQLAQLSDISVNPQIQKYEQVLNSLSSRFLGVSWEWNTSLNTKGRVNLDTNKIELNPYLITNDTPWHEFGHIIIRGIKNTNPELFEQLKKDVFSSHKKNPDNSSYKIVADLYPELLGTDLFWEEAITTELGKEVSSNRKNIWNKIMDFIKSIFGKSFSDVKSMGDLIDVFSNEFVEFRSFSNNPEVSFVMEQRLKTVNFKSQAARERFEAEVSEAVKDNFNDEYKRLTDKIKNSQWKQIINQAEMTFGKHSKNDKTTLSLPEQALQYIVENNATKQYITPEQIAEALLDYTDYLDSVNIYINSIISHIDTKLADKELRAEAKSALLLHANNLVNRFKKQINAVDSSLFKQRLSENNPITIKQDKLLASINKVNRTYDKLHTELVYDVLAKEFEDVANKMSDILNKDIADLKKSESIYGNTPKRKKLFKDKLDKLEERRKSIPLRENMSNIFKKDDIESYELLNQTAIYSSDAGVNMIGNMIANFYKDSERVANAKLNTLQSIEESFNKDFPSQQLDVREYFKPLQREVTQFYIADGKLEKQTRLSLNSEMNVQNVLNDITKLKHEIEYVLPEKLNNPELTEEEKNILLSELSSKEDALDNLRSTELEKPFIDEYYAISEMLPKEIRKQRQEIFEAITSIYNTFSGTQITEEGIELIKNLRKQLVDLESPYDAFGNMKVGPELETAMIIKTWKDKRFEEEVMTWEITDEAKKTFTELYRRQSLAYRQVVDNPSSTQEEKDEALKAFDNWRELYVRNTISEEFYEMRSEITDAIDNILSKYDRTTMSSLYDNLFTLLKGHKDKNGIYDATQITNEKQLKVKEADIAIEDAKRMARIHTTISKEDKEALSEQIEKLQEIQVNIPTQYYHDRVKSIKDRYKLEITLAYGSENLPDLDTISAEAEAKYLESQWYKDNHYEVEIYDKTLGEYISVMKPLSSWRATVPTNQDYILTNSPSHYWYKPMTNPKFRNPRFNFDRPTVKINPNSPYYNTSYNNLTDKQKSHLSTITDYYLELQKDQYKYNMLGLILPSIQKENWESTLDTVKLRNIPFATLVEKAKSLLKAGDTETGDNEDIRGVANQADEFEDAIESSSRKLYMRFNRPLPIEQQSFDLMKNLALYTTEAVRFSTMRKHQAKILSSASVIASNNNERINAKKMLDSFVDRVLFGETIVTDDSKLSKILNYGSSFLLGRAGSMALGFNIKSAFKNYTAGISQLLIQGNIYNISRKDLAKGYAQAHKLTPDFIKYETRAGNKSKDLRLLDYYSSLQKGQYENAQKIKTSFLRQYGNVLQTIKRFRDFTEFEIQATIAFAIMSKYQVKKLDSDTYIPLVDAYEIVNNQLQKRSDVDLPEGLEKIIRSEISTANEKTQGLYRAIYQPHGQKFVIYRVLMLFKKWLYQFADARYFKSKINYGTGETRGGFHRELFNFFGDTVRFNGNIAASYSGLTREQKEGVSSAIKEYGLITILMVLTKMVAEDSDEDDDQNYKDYMAWLLKSTTDELETMNPVFEPVQFTHGFIMQKSNGKNWLNRLSDKTFGPLDKTRRILFNWDLYSSDPYYKRSRGKIDWNRTNPFYEGQPSYVALFGQLLGIEQVSVTPTQLEYSSRQFTDINPKTYLKPLTTKYGQSYKQYKIKKRKKTKG